ncbi:hypothetical protein KP509_07G075900 [Ceratopteris richardii]|uniref:Membrane protein of ER body-like protein n=2 Tax=Ceratopteris richardii TaxID=49495 RepID=A0A8T2UMR1_CERRI|nr:hypothetical protein KP509_07G075900 [Ceratopteris richardii]
MDTIIQGKGESSAVSVSQDYGTDVHPREICAEDPTKTGNNASSDEVDVEEEEFAPLLSKRGVSTDGDGGRNDRRTDESESDSTYDLSSQSDAGTRDDVIQEGGIISDEFCEEALEPGPLDSSTGKRTLQSQASNVPVAEFLCSFSDDVANEPFEALPLPVRSIDQVSDDWGERSLGLGSLGLGDSSQHFKDNAGTSIPIIEETHKLETLEAAAPESNLLTSQTRAVRDDKANYPLDFDKPRIDELLEPGSERFEKRLSYDSNIEDDTDNERLREYWTRVLQTSTTNGEIVEEIVKVLKHHQNTHDLLCPICGSCVTRRVILRKRKRTRSFSVERWYEDQVHEIVEEDATLSDAFLPESIDENREGNLQTQDIEAFGCLSCFSLFFRKGRDLFSQLQADVSQNAFTCLPFFFPPYPWGMTHMKQRKTELQGVVHVVEGTKQSEEPIETSNCTCEIGSMLLPHYHWGKMPYLLDGQSSNQIVADVGSGTSVITDSFVQARTRFFDSVPDLFPEYPWGICRKHISGVEGAGMFIEDTQISSNLGGTPEHSNPSVIEDNELVVPEENVRGTLSEPQSSAQPLSANKEDATCTCALVPALIPDYTWGYLSRKNADTVEENKNIKAGTIVETGAQRREGNNIRCDPFSAVLPDYPWGVTSHSREDTMLSDGHSGPQKGVLLHLDSAVLPSYPWGMTSRSRGIAEDSALSNGLNGSQNGAHVRLDSALLPSYPWGKCSTNRSGNEQNGTAQMHHDSAEKNYTGGLGMKVWPDFPWGQTLVKVNNQGQVLSNEEVHKNVEQKTQTKVHVTYQADVVRINNTIATYTGETGPEKTTILNSKITSVGDVRFGQTVIDINASVKVPETAEDKGKLQNRPSTGYAIFEDEGKLQNRPSTGYAFFDEAVPHSEIEEDPTSPCTVSDMIHGSDWDSLPRNAAKNEEVKPQKPSIGSQFPSKWSPGKSDIGTLIDVEKSSDVRVQEPKRSTWISYLKTPNPSDEGGTTALLLHSYPGYIGSEKLKEPLLVPQATTDIEAVIDRLPVEEPISVGTTTTGASLPAPERREEADNWNILKSIVYGGLDISIASFGVTSSAAGGNAITRTVVYMGIATLFSGLIAFYHNVLNLYHYHRDHYIDIVGFTLLLHGTVALISYIVFGLLSPLVYGFSYRATDNRDDKFILCCGVTVVAVTTLALCKAKVSNRSYLKTTLSYLSGGVLAGVIGYLTGEHVAELLEEWGI